MVKCYSANSSIHRGEGKGNEIGGLAEVASCQVEYAYLAKASGKKEYFKLVSEIINCPCDTLYATRYSVWRLTRRLGRPHREEP
jgi:hypothetical protein